LRKTGQQAAETPADDTAEQPVSPAPPADAPAASSAPEPVPAFDPSHEWPSKGGCYVRQADGTLKIED
jgi:hypothetical protein